MSDQNDKGTSEPSLTLAPPDTAAGAIERAFLAETRSPGDPKYDLTALDDQKKCFEIPNQLGEAALTFHITHERN